MLGGLPAISTGAAIPAPGSITVHPSGITYYAQLGDTLISIAQRWTNKTANWVALGKINQVNKDSNIPVGSPIVIPTELLADEASEATVIAPIADARSYHVQIAQDAEMLHMLAEAGSNTRELAINDIQECNYFVRIAAIDKFGLKGMPRTLAVAINNRIESAQELPTQAAPSVAHSDQKELTLRWPGSASQKYNVQVARDLEFSWLLFTSSVTGNEIKLPRPSFGTYFARVQSINADGSSNPFSSAQTLIATDHWIINDGQPLPPKKMSRTTTP